MKTMKIGFIAGCINIPTRIDAKDLYYVVLLRELQEKYPHIMWESCVDIYSAYSQVIEKANTFLEKNEPQILCFFIRFFPLMVLYKPLVKYENAKKEKAWAFHPALFSPKADWNPQFSRFVTETGYQFSIRRRFAGRDLNLLAGKMLGLHAWANRYVCKQIKSLHDICTKKGVKLIVVSPPRNPESYMGNIVCQEITECLNSFCAQENISFANIYHPLDIVNFEKDAVHYNAQGHRRMAEIVLPFINKD